MTHYEQSDRREDETDMSAVNMRNIRDPRQIAGLPIRLLGGAGTWMVLSEDAEPHLLLSPALRKGAFASKDSL